MRHFRAAWWALWLVAPASFLSAQEPPSILFLEAQVEEARASSPQALAMALQELVDGYAYSGRHSEAIAAAREAMRVLGTTADTAALATLHNELGLAFWNQVEYDSAVAHFSHAAPSVPTARKSGTMRVTGDPWKGM